MFPIQNWLYLSFCCVLDKRIYTIKYVFQTPEILPSPHHFFILNLYSFSFFEWTVVGCICMRSMIWISFEECTDLINKPICSHFFCEAQGRAPFQSPDVYLCRVSWKKRHCLKFIQKNVWLTGEQVLLNPLFRESCSLIFWLSVLI